jgi:hypothetical protein
MGVKNLRIRLATRIDAACSGAAAIPESAGQDHTRLPGDSVLVAVDPWALAALDALAGEGAVSRREAPREIVAYRRPVTTPAEPTA